MTSSVEKPAHRVFRGLHRDGDESARIVVVDGGTGPTERERASQLYELTVKSPCWWGYTGSSPSRTAEAIVDDVLPEVLPAEAIASMPSKARTDLVVAFTHDMLAFAHDSNEMWLPASAVSRWLTGYLHARP